MCSMILSYYQFQVRMRQTSISWKRKLMKKREAKLVKETKSLERMLKGSGDCRYFLDVVLAEGSRGGGG